MTKGIMIAGYGTRKGNLEEILERQAARMRARGIANVYIGYFRVSSPSIPEVLEQMAADGVDDVLVMPYYIAEGRLTYELIPGKLGISGNVGTVDVKGKNVKVRMAPAFGNNPVLADIVCDRVADAGGDFDDGVMVIGHGSRDSVSSNKDIMEMNADRLRRRGFKNVAYTFNEFCEPTIADAVGSLAAAGVDRIIAVPLFVAMGLHLGEEVPEQIGIPAYSQGGEITAGGRKIEVRYTRPVEDDVRLLETMVAGAKNFYGM